MARRRTSATTADSRRSTPLPVNVQNPLRRSPRSLPRLNYQEKKARSSSSIGSTGRSMPKQSCLKISLKATLVNNFGETDYCGSEVFLLTERAHRSSLHARTRELVAEVVGASLNTNPTVPVRVEPAPQIARHQLLYQEYRRKAEENAKVIMQAEAEVAAIRAARNARELAEACAGKRKVGESSGTSQKPHSPCFGEKEAMMAAIKEEEPSEDDNPTPQVRTRSRSTPQSGAPSEW